MAHHGNFPREAMSTSPALKDLMKQLGATNRFPEGKLDPSDEGEIRFAVSHQAGKVVMAFGKSVAWVGCSPTQAKELAELLIHHAEEALKIE